MAPQQAFKDEQPPLVSPAKSIRIHLAKEYAKTSRAAAYEAKAAFLERRYAAMRQVRGDGNCMYRALLTGWMEWLLRMPLAVQAYALEWLAHRALSLSLELAPQLPGAGGDELLTLGTAFARRTRALCGAEGGSASWDALLHAAVSDGAATADSIRWLRLLASAHMRRHRAAFEGFCMDGRHATFEEFVAAEVEAMGVEGETMQLTALADALQLRVRLEVLASTDVSWSGRSGGHRCLMRGPDAAAAAADEAPRPLLLACVLFRPGHYDVLSPRADPGSSLSTALLAAGPETVALPPTAPAPPGTPCEGCGRPMLGCLLCGRGVCQAARATTCKRFGQPVDAPAAAGASVGGRFRFSDDAALMHLLPAGWRRE
eukprot:5495401-Prymnesium_polylepis.1